MKIVANLDLGTNTKAVNVVDPTDNQDMATKAYTNTKISSTPPTMQVFTTTGAGSYTTPSNCRLLKIIAIGGGGGGGIRGGSTGYELIPAGGGGGGGCVIAWLSSPASSYTFTVGTGGTTGAGTATTFVSGATTLISAGGGAKGGTPTTTLPGAGGAGGTCTVASPLVNGTNCILLDGGDGTVGATNRFGGGTSTSTPASGGAGGGTYLAGYSSVQYVETTVNADGVTVDRIVRTPTEGINGKNYGGGGGGSVGHSTTYGNGAGGILIIEEYY